MKNAHVAIRFSEEKLGHTVNHLKKESEHYNQLCIGKYDTCACSVCIDSSLKNIF